MQNLALSSFAAAPTLAQCDLPHYIKNARPGSMWNACHNGAVDAGEMVASPASSAVCTRTTRRNEIGRKPLAFARQNNITVLWWQQVAHYAIPTKRRHRDSEVYAQEYWSFRQRAPAYLMNRLSKATGDKLPDLQHYTENLAFWALACAQLFTTSE